MARDEIVKKSKLALYIWEKNELYRIFRKRKGFGRKFKLL